MHYTCETEAIELSELWRHVHPQEIDAAQLHYGGVEYRFAVTNKIDTDTVLEICKRVNDQWTCGYDNNSWLHKDPLDLIYRHVACFLKEFLPRCI